MPQNRATDISIKALLVAGSLSLLALWWAWPRLKSKPRMRAETSSQLIRFGPRALPNFNLTGSRGELSPESLKGYWTLLYFGYTRCPDDCPTTLAALAALRHSLLTSGADRSLRFTFVSVAADDDAERVQDFAAGFDSSFEGYAGSWDDREKLFLYFDVGVDSAFERGPDQYFHAPNIYLIDPEAHYVATWSRLPDRIRFHDELCGFINCNH